jgi:putative SOS response-associated peptidase YedK
MLATTTILTRDSTGVLQPIHDRMPLALEPEDYDRWLGPSDTPGAELIAEVSQKAADTADLWEHYEVPPLRGDGPHLAERKETA